MSLATAASPRPDDDRSGGLEALAKLLELPGPEDASDRPRLGDASWQDSTLLVSLEAPGLDPKVVMLDRKADGRRSFLETDHLAISYQGTELPGAIASELRALAGRIGSVSYQALRDAFGAPSEGATTGGRTAQETELGDLPAVLEMLGPFDDADVGLRLNAASWWGDELVIEIEGPDLAPSTLVLAAIREGRRGYAQTDNLAVLHEGAGLAPDLERAYPSLLECLGGVTFDAITLAYPPPTTVTQAEGGDPAALGCGGATSGDEHAVCRAWSGDEQWRHFFASWEIDRNVLRSVSLSLDCVYVEHGDLECTHSTPQPRGRVPTFINYPWRPQPPEPEGSDHDAGDLRDGSICYTTDLDESDVVLGGAEKLEALLDEISKKHRGKTVHFNCTCPPIVIADEVNSLITNLRKKHDAPVIHTTQDPGSSLYLFADMLRTVEDTAGGATRDPRAVNLVGFARDRGTGELVDLLAAIGVRTNSCLIPNATREELARFPRAKAMVFYPSAPWQRIYRIAFGKLPLERIDAPGPFGMEGTRRWLEAVARAVDPEVSVEAAWQRRMDELGPSWKELAEEARRHRLAFVVDASDFARLVSAERMMGIPMLAVLDEMGFGIDVLYYDESAELAGEVTAYLEALPGQEHRAHAFETPAQLADLLRELPARACYSELFFDKRITRAGKAQFSSACFEKGMGGALRSLERLLDVCRLPFYARYGSYLRSGPRA